MNHKESAMTIELPVTLTVRGKAIKSGDAQRTLHNDTAGSPQGVAAARALGDLSHKVYAPLGGDAKPEELLFLDVWIDATGIGKFFSSPEVQAPGAQLFSAKDATVWMPARGAYTYSLPAPRDRVDRFVGIVRGAIASPERAIEIFKANDAKGVGDARKRGQISHELFIRVGAPSEPVELLGIDIWFDEAGMNAHYSDATHMHALGGAFTGKPAASTWKQAPGLWSEW
jgi:quinol monooxygenase YgiN